MDGTETFVNGGNDNHPNQFSPKPIGQQIQKQNNIKSNYAVKCGKLWWAGNTWGTNPAKLSLQDAEKILQNTLAYTGRQAEIQIMPDRKQKQSQMTGWDNKLTFIVAGFLFLLLAFAGIQP